MDQIYDIQIKHIIYHGKFLVISYTFAFSISSLGNCICESYEPVKLKGS
jgi:hypothetical protein